MPSPFEDMGIAAEWFDRAAIGKADRLKIDRINPQGLFHFQANRPNLKGKSGHLGVVDSSERNCEPVHDWRKIAFSSNSVSLRKRFKYPDV